MTDVAISAGTNVLTFACALPGEERLARRIGKTVLVGSRCNKGIPQHEVVAYGYVGSLRRTLKPGMVLEVRKILTLAGEERDVPALNIPGAKPAVVLGVDRVITKAAELDALSEQFPQADAIHTEIDRYPNLRGGILAITDYPDSPLGRLGLAIDENDEFVWKEIWGAFQESPWQSICVSLNWLKATWALRGLVLQA